jgi:hypothetical protein
MKNKVAGPVLVVVLLASAGWIWYWTRSSAEAGPDGYPLVCTRCDHFFTLDDNALASQPRSPTGEGFKCPRCGRFGAQVAARCDKCGQWTAMQQDAAGTAFCPKCPRPASAEAGK